MGIEVILEKGQDGIWRINRERVLAKDELKHDKGNGEPALGRLKIGFNISGA